jgi:hypothetical protein
MREAEVADAFRVNLSLCRTASCSRERRCIELTEAHATIGLDAYSKVEPAPFPHLRAPRT